MLDLMIAQAIFRARQIERAVHDRGPWTVSYGNQVAPAVRWVGSDRVIFRAHFPDACWLPDTDSCLTLLCRDEMVGTKSIVTPADGEFTVEWTFTLPVPVHV